MLQTYFDKYGHQCKLNLNRPFNKILKNKCYLRKWFISHSVISRDYILLRGRPHSCAMMRNKILNQMMNFPYTVHPFSKIAYVCDLIWMVAVLMFAIQKPMEIFNYLKNDSFFNERRNFTLYKFIDTSIYFVDSIRRFFTGYLISHPDSDEIVLDLRRISLHYLKTYFFFDFLPCLSPLIKLAFDVNSPFYVSMEMLPYIRLIRIPTVLGVVKNIMRFYHLNHDLIDIFNAILVLCIAVNWVSCFSVVGGIIERHLNPNAFVWYDNILTPDSSGLYKYVKCCHRTLSILTGTGYPFYLNNTKSVNDMLYTIFTAVLGHILTMFIFAKSFEIFNGLGSSSEKFVELEVEISDYMKHHNVSKTIQNKIKTYHAYKYKYSYFNEPELLAAVPNSLQQSILMHSARTVFENSSLNKYPTTIVASILPLMSKEIVLAGDVIFRSREDSDSMYFLLSGTVAMFTYSGREMFHFEDGSNFGIGFFVFQNYKYFGTILAIETSELLRIHSKHLYAIADCCPDFITDLSRVALQLRDLHDNMEETFLLAYSKRLLLENKVNKEPEIVEND